MAHWVVDSEAASEEVLEEDSAAASEEVLEEVSVPTWALLAPESKLKMENSAVVTRSDTFVPSHLLFVIQIFV